VSTRPVSCTAPSVAVRSTTTKLQGNLAALIDALNKAKPASSKGLYLRKVAVSSTMGVGVRVDTQTIAA
jgi:large subunit ribosomal protein L1